MRDMMNTNNLGLLYATVGISLHRDTVCRTIPNLTQYRSCYGSSLILAHLEEHIFLSRKRQGRDVPRCSCADVMALFIPLISTERSIETKHAVQQAS